MGEEAVADIRAIVALRLSCRLTAWCRARPRRSRSGCRQRRRGRTHLIARLGHSSAGHEEVPRMGHRTDWRHGRSGPLAVRIRFGRRTGCVAGSPQFPGALRTVGAAGRRRSLPPGRHRGGLESVSSPCRPHETSRTNARGWRWDFTATTIWAWPRPTPWPPSLAGAASADVTVNGLGERAGNAPLEEVAMAVKLTLGSGCGVDTRRFAELSAFVAKASGRTLAARKPVVGAGVYRHESGIHVRGLLADRRTYEAFPAETVGHRETEIVLENIPAQRPSSTFWPVADERSAGRRPPRWPPPSARAVSWQSWSSLRLGVRKGANVGQIANPPYSRQVGELPHVTRERPGYWPSPGRSLPCPVAVPVRPLLAR